MTEETLKEKFDADEEKVAQKWDDEKVKLAVDHLKNTVKDAGRSLKAFAKNTAVEDKHILKHLEHQLKFDGGLANLHAKHLLRVIEYREDQVAKAEAQVAKRIAAGKSEASIERAEKHEARVTAAAAKRIDDIVEAEIKHFQNDAEAAVAHIKAAIAKAADRDEDGVKELEDKAAEVKKAVENLYNVVTSA